MKLLKIKNKKQKPTVLFCTVLFTAFIFSCGPIPNIQEIEDTDITPPIFTDIRTISENELELNFNEITALVPDKIKITPDTRVEMVKDNRKDTRIFTGTQIPGLEYKVQVTAEDKRGNSNTFIVKFYGFNPDVPKLLINEFTTQGTGKHPDTVELRSVADGNMGGITLYDGTPLNYRVRFVFPNFKVKTNEYILIHFKPQGIQEEVNETGRKDLSAGYDSSANAYDFWIEGGAGLSGNNGVLSLFSRPGGKLLDGILYSNRTSASDDRYRGFGTRDSMERADELAEYRGWRTKDDTIKPEDGINPEDSTGTRSICRNSSSTDTDSKGDWHIVPTRGATFGNINSDEVY